MSLPILLLTSFICLGLTVDLVCLLFLASLYGVKMREFNGADKGILMRSVQMHARGVFEAVIYLLLLGWAGVWG